MLFVPKKKKVKTYIRVYIKEFVYNKNIKIFIALKDGSMYNKKIFVFFFFRELHENYIFALQTIRTFENVEHYFKHNSKKTLSNTYCD